jgi:DNA-binding LacI/PurR family transcriptional regulator
MHKSSVSVAFSGKGNLSAATRERVLAKAREMGYEPHPLAQRLAHGGASNSVYIFTGSVDAGLATEKILLIQNALRQQRLEVPLYVCGESSVKGDSSQAAELRNICRQRPRAIVCATNNLSSDIYAELEKFQRGGGIVVTFDVPVPLQCDQIIFDREDNAYQAARYLLDRGHRQIGMAFTHASAGSFPSAGIVHNYRLAGFRKALAEYHVPLREEWIYRVGTYEKGGTELASAFLQQEERPSALCVVNDYVAMAFVVEVMRAGLPVPEEVSVVSHDNQPITSYCPVPLTSTSQPVKAICDAVVEMLGERLKEGAETPAPPRTVVITGEFFERESVAPPK